MSQLDTFITKLVYEYIPAYNFEMEDGSLTASVLGGPEIIYDLLAYSEISGIDLASTGTPKKGLFYHFPRGRKPGLLSRIAQTLVPGRLVSMALRSVDGSPLLLDAAQSVFPGTPDGEVVQVYKGELEADWVVKVGWPVSTDHPHESTVHSVVLTLRYTPDDPANEIDALLTGVLQESVLGRHGHVHLTAKSENPLRPDQAQPDTENYPIRGAKLGVL